MKLLSVNEINAYQKAEMSQIKYIDKYTNTWGYKYSFVYLVITEKRCKMTTAKILNILTDHC